MVSVKKQRVRLVDESEGAAGENEDGVEEEEGGKKEDVEEEEGEREEDVGENEGGREESAEGNEGGKEGSVGGKEESVGGNEGGKEGGVEGNEDGDAGLVIALQATIGTTIPIRVGEYSPKDSQNFRYEQVKFLSCYFSLQLTHQVLYQNIYMYQVVVQTIMYSLNMGFQLHYNQVRTCLTLIKANHCKL
eukprot:TRINITY_DN518_c0_g2_i1.p2 TRINITY_DN518_c0_g2~~TRINITY_DN518_c0_g2_i1.p2  ORF type:complete len:190 (-),score=6.86 TRINITY_DN518_c0_g2_i1:290-859(-)